MVRLTGDLSPEARGGFDAIIDVRSPSEFAEDHLPGAINLPVLNDAERALIGEEYVQRSKFVARRQGAALVARNIARHLDVALADRGGGFRPLVYCWRGGQRSGAMATVMAQVGWQVAQLDGGYQTWRRRVVAQLYDTTPVAPPLRVVLLDGLTGVGKTQVLRRVGALGAQTLDLEDLAQHRGSAFGATPTAQPSQKLFESRLVTALESFDLTRPVLVEAESSRIGGVTLPPRLWAAMKTAPRFRLTAPISARVSRLMAEYDSLSDDAEALDHILTRMPRHHGRTTRDAWRRLAASGQIRTLVRRLLQEHYDPAYARSARHSISTLEVRRGASDDRAAQAVLGLLSELEAADVPTPPGGAAG